VKPLGVVELDVSLYALLLFRYRFIVIEKNIFILEGRPESLDVDIVQRQVDTVHTDCYAPGLSRSVSKAAYLANISIEDIRHQELLKNDTTHS
jgi:hypothetical protein